MAMDYEFQISRSFVAGLLVSSNYLWFYVYFFFFFNDTATTEIYTNLNTFSLHDALPISSRRRHTRFLNVTGVQTCVLPIRSEEHTSELQSHSEISYAVFCLKTKKNTNELKTQPHIPYQMNNKSKKRPKKNKTTPNLIIEARIKLRQNVDQTSNAKN